MIIIVDYGVGNLAAIRHKLRRLGFEAEHSSREEDILAADKLILPGVGHFAEGMKNLAASGLIDALRRKVFEERTPILGICLGMQLLAEKSEEGGPPGLAWLEADVVRFHFQGPAARLRVPHVGWNEIRIKRPSPLFADLPEDCRFYFTHSFYLRCRKEEDVAATTAYGLEFPSVVQRGNIFGAQFHPEKSHDYGMTVLANFLRFA